MSRTKQSDQHVLLFSNLNLYMFQCSGLPAGLPYIAVAMVTPLGGLLGDRMMRRDTSASRTRNFMLMISFLPSVLAICLCSFTHNEHMVLVLLVIAVGFYGFSYVVCLFFYISCSHPVLCDLVYI